MVHTIPKEYVHDAQLIDAYNRGFQHGYNDDPSPWKYRTDAQRLAYANGRREGQLKRRKENAGD